MKILGFEFGPDVGMSAQVSSIRRKFNARKWVLTHLSHCGITKESI